MKKLGKFEFKPADLSFEKKILVQSVQTKIISSFMHNYVQCIYIVSAKFQIAPSIAVVGIDRPIKALSMHIQKPYKVKLSKFNKNYKLLHAYVQWVYIISTKYQIASSKAVVGVDRPIKALSMHIQKPYKGIIV